jgi:hypothetical protein
MSTSDKDSFTDLASYGTLSSRLAKYSMHARSPEAVLPRVPPATEDPSPALSANGAPCSTGTSLTLKDTSPAKDSATLLLPSANGGPPHEEQSRGSIQSDTDVLMTRAAVTNAVLQMQQELQSELHEEQLQLLSELGRGGFGTVYRGASSAHPRQFSLRSRLLHALLLDLVACHGAQFLYTAPTTPLCSHGDIS